MGCNLVLITNRKSHTGFRFVPRSVTLNDLESPNDCYVALLLNALASKAKRQIG